MDQKGQAGRAEDASGPKRGLGGAPGAGARPEPAGHTVWL